jgi:hypothetical protein
MHTNTKARGNMIDTTVVLAAALALGAGLGCGGSSKSPTDSGSDGVIADGAAGSGDAHDGAAGSGGSGDGAAGSDGAVDGGFPAPPVLGAQIDRMGRAAINTALIHGFDTDTTAKNAAKDAYNAALPATWSTFTPEIAKNLAILDSLDTNCHNQFLWSAAHDGADRYNALAGALADDQLYVDMGTGSCMQYLGVELKATGGMPTLIDCGGRTPLYDVIDVTYSVVSIGALTGVTDGINADDMTPSITTFPFLVAP